MTFDLLGPDGPSLMPPPSHERRKRVAALLEQAEDGLRFSGHVEGN
jgi:ATP-dependent DNA ligase